jgi:hypothetical protein
MKENAKAKRTLRRKEREESAKEKNDYRKRFFQGRRFVFYSEDTG